MRRTNDKKPSQTESLRNPITLNLQTRPFAPIQVDDETQVNEVQAKYNSSGDLLRKLIDNPAPEAIAPTRRNPFPSLRNQANAIQAKLNIGEPNDKYEQEADRTAAQVVQQINSSPQEQSVQRSGAIEEDEELQMKPVSSIQRDEAIEDEELQMKPLVQRSENLGCGEASTDLESAIQSARGSEQSLDGSLAEKLGQSMETDFSSVRVRNDSTANHLSQSIQAKAFTTDNHLLMKQSTYNPSSTQELTYNLKQGSNPQIQAKQDLIQREEEGGINSGGISSSGNVASEAPEILSGNLGDSEYFEEQENQEKEDDKLKIKLIEIQLPEVSTKVGGGELKGTGNVSLESLAKGGGEVKITFEKGGTEFDTGEKNTQGTIKGQSIDYSGQAKANVALRETKYNAEGEVKGDYEKGTGKYNFGAKGKASAMRGVTGEVEGGANTTFANNTELGGKVKGEGAIKGEIGGEIGGKFSNEEWGTSGKLGAFLGAEANIEPEIVIKSGGTVVFQGKAKGGLSIGIGGEIAGNASWGEGGTIRLAGKAKLAAGLGLNLEYDVTINPYGIAKLASMWGLFGWAGQKSWEATKWTGQKGLEATQWAGNKLWNTGKWALGY